MVSPQENSKSYIGGLDGQTEETTAGMKILNQKSISFIDSSDASIDQGKLPQTGEARVLDMDNQDLTSQIESPPKQIDPSEVANGVLNEDEVATIQDIEEVAKFDLQQNEQMAEMVTADVFYEMLAEVISEPIPTRKEGMGPIERVSPQFDFGANQRQRVMIEPDRGIATDIGAIDQYLESVIEEVIKSGIDKEGGFAQNISEPVIKDPLDTLQLLQNSDLGSYEHFENVSLRQPVLSLDMYLDIERQKEEKDAILPIEEQMDEDIIEQSHIHRKMLFDSVNEALNKHRPYGEDGLPMPWSSGKRVCSTKDVQLEKIFETVKNDLREKASICAGVMPRAEFINQMTQQFDEEMFADI